MTKIAKILNIAFGRYVVGKTRLKETTISNEGTERITIAKISSSSSSFKAELTKTLQAKFPINSTLYYGDVNGKFVDANGSYYTTNQGFGVIGTTNAVGFLTPSTDTPFINITAPTALSKHQLSTAFNVVLSTANVALCNIILESESGGYKIYENLDCSSGSLTQSVQILESDVFSPNETVYIYAQATIGTAEDSRQIQSLATVTLTAIDSITATVAKTISGTTNGASVNVYYKLHSAGSWTLAGAGTVDTVAKTWSYSLTIATAGTYDIKVVDGTDADAYALQENIVVASGTFSFQFGGTGNDLLFDTIKIGSDYYVAGTTQSSTLFGVSSGYSAGVGRNFLAKLNSTGVKQWILFGDTDSKMELSNSLCYNSATSRLFWLSKTYSDGVNVSDDKIKKVDLDGNIEATYTFTRTSTTWYYDFLQSICCDDNNVYVVGYSYDGVTEVGSVCWKLPHTLASATIKGLKGILGLGAYNVANSIAQNATKLFPLIVDYTNNKTYVGSVTKSTMYVGAATADLGRLGMCVFGCSATRILAMTNDGTNRRLKMIQLSDMSVLFNQSLDTDITDVSASITWDSINSKFVAIYRNADKSKLVINSIDDADSYTSRTRTITANEGTFQAVIPSINTSNKFVISATIDGKLLSDSTDAGGYDCTIIDEG